MSVSSSAPYRGATAAVVWAFVALAMPAVLSAQSVAIMPVGDSITQGFGGQCGYRKFLSRTLSRHPSCETELVGPLVHDFGGARDDPSCAATETPSLAVSGRTALDLYESGDLTRAVLDDAPDYVLLHMGSNDMRLGSSVPVIVDLNDRLITQVFDARPGATVLLAGIIPWDPVPRPAYTRGPFDAPDVDEAARSDEIASALGTLAARRRAAGFDVVHVDMRPGFDSPSMTYDGVHPNDAGEVHLARRYLDALIADGACASDQAPALTLEHDAWYQIGLPGDPGENGRVADVFGPALGLEGLGTVWTVFGFDAGRYSELDGESRLRSGKGYWIIQRSGSAKTIRLPEATLPVSLDDRTAACTGPRGCVGTPLDTDANGPRWNMLGSPFNGPSALAGARVATSGEPCADGGCRLVEAGEPDVDLLFDTFFHWDPDLGPRGEYRQLRAGDSLPPWSGFWAAALTGAHDSSARLVLAPR